MEKKVLGKSRFCGWNGRLQGSQLLAKPNAVYVGGGRVVNVGLQFAIPYS